MWNRKILITSFLAVPLFLFFAGCGQQQPFQPIGIAPAPNASYVPSGVPYAGAGPYGNAGGNGYFNPQLPGAYPQQFYPFLPVYYFFQQNPQLQQYWSGFWQQWIQYAYASGVSQYNFQAFWYGYAQSAWGSGSYSSLYGYFNYNVYGWMNQSTVLPPQVNPQVFWQNYVGFPYASAGSYCGCN
jgi:hypothetical protein